MYFNAVSKAIQTLYKETIKIILKKSNLAFHKIHKLLTCISSQFNVGGISSGSIYTLFYSLLKDVYIFYNVILIITIFILLGLVRR